MVKWLQRVKIFWLPCRRTGSPVRQKPITPPIEVTAEDVKGNLSNREQSMVVVQAPTLSQKDSSVSLSTQTLNADSHSTATLTFIAHDAAGNPVIGLVLSTRHEGVQDITLSDWKDNGDGSYTQVLTTGAMSGTLTLMPQLNGVDAAKAPAVVNIISVSSSRTHSSIKIDMTVISPAILSR